VQRSEDMGVIYEKIQYVQDSSESAGGDLFETYRKIAVGLQRVTIVKFEVRNRDCDHCAMVAYRLV